jgi:hypothetical protein
MYRILLLCVCISLIVQVVAAGSTGGYAALVIDCRAALTFATAGKHTVEISASTSVSFSAKAHPAAFVSTEALVLLDDISLHVPVVCASGMGVSEMEHYQKRFPMIDHWVLENGGRVFSRGRSAQGERMMLESTEYARYAYVYDVYVYVCVCARVNVFCGVRGS